VGDPVRDWSRIDKVVAESGLDIPSDLVHGSYRWRAYLYANLFKNKKIDVDGKIALNELSSDLLPCHIMPWSRKRMVPLDETRKQEMLVALSQVTVFSTDSGDVFRAGLWQMHALEDELYYTDDHVLSLIPRIGDYVRKSPEQGGP
jgi:hypothetical protein